MDQEQRGLLVIQLKQFASMRSLEIAKGNYDRLSLLLENSQKDVQIRELTLQNFRLSSQNTYANTNPFDGVTS
ncbi:hypothetical protein M9Y10_044096 [Tritrichomonas musculus]|uniref:Uncharacterized protein n=1 Tax=Tritrichomonas musculus TaxID=1915356 RepID=A0ABR2K1H1_9EUKA